MNWKKFLLIGLAISGLAFGAAPRAEAQISVGIGFGFPVANGCYGDPGYYPYGYGYYGPRRYYSPRRYYGSRRYYGPRRAVYAAPRYYWSHGRRVYYRNRNWR